ncbi:MAG: Ig-like domain-containing protein [Bergeyella zoohelcum]|nr:Ig-like domain-containing protein [Bergeyella zoohelcum]
MKKLLFVASLSLATLGMVVSCSRDDDSGTTSVANYTLSPSEATTNYDKTVALSVKNGSSTLSPSEFTWSVSDEKRGTIGNDGVFKAKKVGKVEVTATKNGQTLKSTINIAPYSTLFTEPLMYFGKTKEEVKSKETRTFIREYNNFLAFKGENRNVSEVLYHFDSNGKIDYIGVRFPYSASIVENLATFYIERHNFLGESNGEYYFNHIDENATIGLTTSTNGIIVVYTAK